jgi:hypothetical protein
MARFVQRIVGALALNPDTYEDIEHDQNATVQALGVVVLSSLAASIGAGGGLSINGVVGHTAVGLASWVLWTLIVLQVGGRIWPETSTRVTTSELLRTIGFATAPGLIQMAGVVPGLATPSLVVAWCWMLAAVVVGVRQALDYRRPGHALLVCLIGWLVAFTLTAGAGLLLTTAAH